MNSRYRNFTRIQKFAIILGALAVIVSGYSVFRVFGNTIINATINTQPALESGLVAHYTFDGIDMVTNVADRSGNDNNGALQGQTSTTTASGVIGQALEFDGQDDFIDVSSNVGNVQSISFWTKPDSTTEEIMSVGGGGGGGAWYSDYQYRREITINASQVATTSSSYPVLATTTLADLKTTGNGGKVESSGNDMVFVDDDHSTLLAFEQESYSTSTGAVVYWINTDVSSTTDKTIYLYYGKASDTNHENPTAVWPSYYTGVWHMAEDPTPQTNGPCAGSATEELCDSTSNNRHADSAGSMTSGDQVTGQVGGTVNFDGSDDYMDTGTALSTFQTSSSVTISVWARPTGTAASHQDLDSLPAIISDAGGFFGIHRGNHTSAPTGDRIWGFHWFFQPFGVGATYTVAEWTHVVLVHANNSIYLYKDGAFIGSTSSGGTQDATNNLLFAKGWTSNNFTGDIDEVRISNIALTHADFMTQYEMSSDNASFLTIGSEEEQSSGGFSVSLAGGTASSTGVTSTIYIDGIATATFPDTDWHHVVMVTDSAVAADSVELGRVDSTYFGGSLDDVRLYNRALSADEIQRLYKLGATTKLNTTVTSEPALESGLVGHWTFDGADMLQNVADRSGNSNDGALQGQMSTTTAFGAIGQALEFDGEDDSIVVPGSASLKPTDALSFSLWVYPNQINNGTNPRLLDFAEGAGNHIQGYRLLITDPLSGLALQPRFSFGNGSAIQDVNGAPVTIGAWQHIAGTWDGSDLKIYQDGALTDEEALTGPISYTGVSSLFLGVQNNEINNHFSGKTDDLRIYDRALSAGEVARLYQLGNF